VNLEFIYLQLQNVYVEIQRLNKIFQFFRFSQLPTNLRGLHWLVMYQGHGPNNTKYTLYHHFLRRQMEKLISSRLRLQRSYVL